MVDVPPQNLAPMFKRSLASALLVNTGLPLAKGSCLLFYTRIFNRPRVSVRLSWALRTAHALNISTCVACTVTAAVKLNPHSVTTGQGDIFAVWLSAAVSSVVMDLILMLLPMPMIWGLKVKMSRKIAIICIFFFGYW